MDLKTSYKSQGDYTIANDFLNPALKMSKEYKRSVGFFSSGGLLLIMDGLVGIAKNKGHIKLIASPRLNDEDINAIKIGYEHRNDIIKGVFERDFTREIEQLQDVNLQILYDLISSGILDIKIAVICDHENNVGIYHDKLGILCDFDGNKMVFYGSPNSSIGAYQANYEKIRVFPGWEEAFKKTVFDEEQEFDSIWDGTNPFLEINDFSKAAAKNILEVIKKKGEQQNKNQTIQLRDYQEEAIQAWVNNNYHGFYVMATGTGKTWTAIYAAKRLIGSHPCLPVIIAPYKHLVKQWSEDVQAAFPNATIVLVSSENPEWENQITNQIIKCKYDKNAQLIIISTITSFGLDRFSKAVKKYQGEKLLIVDEAHRFTSRPMELQDQYQYMLGLSATPFSGKSAQKGFELMKFFGGEVFNLPIEDALERHFLVPYYYYPIIVNATADEEDRFNSYSKIILSCFKDNVCIDPDKLVKALRGRLRVISMAQGKMQQIEQIINKIPEKDHFVVYCGDGKLIDQESGEAIKHISAIKQVLSEMDYKASQFTATENMSTRMQLVELFNKGMISTLVAIRCLDEGINIPSIKSALILSSNDDYREFVQRRGRILRLYPGKEYAVIYDVVVLPSSDMSQWASIELRRFHEYAKLAMNWNDLEGQLDDILSMYDLSLDDVDVYNYEDVEEPCDE